jgi:hypothetical protein
MGRVPPSVFSSRFASVCGIARTPGMWLCRPPLTTAASVCKHAGSTRANPPSGEGSLPQKVVGKARPMLRTLPALPRRLPQCFQQALHRCPQLGRSLRMPLGQFVLLVLEIERGQ